MLEKKSMNIRTDSGRILRPLFVLENLYAEVRSRKPSLVFEELLQQGILEYIDAREEDSLLVAPNFDVPHLYECTHAELHNTLSLSMNTNTQAPFCNHNQVSIHQYLEPKTTKLTLYRVHESRIKMPWQSKVNPRFLKTTGTCSTHARTTSTTAKNHWLRLSLAACRACQQRRGSTPS